MEVYDEPFSVPMILRINDVVVHLIEETLRDTKGERLTLRPQSFAILRHLVIHGNRLVTKDQLIDAIWHGAAVTDDSVVQCVHEIRRVLRDNRRSILQTISKRGYRLNLATREDIAHSDRTSLAVLAFTASGCELEDEHLAAGLADDIAAGLLKFRGFRVTVVRTRARDDLRKVAAEVGARYLVGGSIRRVGRRLRITSELVDGVTGSLVWASSFDGSAIDPFDLQDRVVRQIVGKVEPSIRKAEIERARRRRTEHQDSYGKFLQAIPHALANTAADCARALDLLSGALALDPDYLPAHGYAAWCYEQRYLRNGFDPADRAAALAHADIALGVNSDDTQAIGIAAFVRANLTRDYDAAVEAMDRALAINGDSSLILGFSALVCAHSERFDRAVQDATKALWLSLADDPMNYHPYCALAVSNLFAGRFAEAARYASLTTSINPAFSVPHVYLVASLVNCGDLTGAKAAARRLLEVAPNFSISGFARMNLFRAPLTEAIVSAITKADLPE